MERIEEVSSCSFLPLTEASQCNPARRCAPIISKPRQLPSLRLCRHRPPVGNWVGYSCFGERAQAQQTTVASATGCIFALIARPRQMQRRPKLDPAPDYFALPHSDDRSNNLDSCFRPRTGPNQLLKRLAIFRTAIRIA